MRARLMILAVALAACVEAPPDKPVVIQDGSEDTMGEQTIDEPAMDQPTTDPPTETGDETPMEEEIPDAVGVQIIDVAVSSDMLRPRSGIVVSVRLTHPEGFDAVGGGRLLTASGAFLGNFAGSAGVYEYLLEWDGLNNAEPINFDTDTTGEFVVMFFDYENRESVESFALTLTCNGGPACGGSCDELECGGRCYPASDAPDGCN